MSLFEGPVHVIICAGLQIHPVKKPLRRATSSPRLAQFNGGGQLFSVPSEVRGTLLSYLFCYAQRAKAVCGVQIQVVLRPADDLFLAFSFRVSLKEAEIK